MGLRYFFKQLLLPPGGLLLQVFRDAKYMLDVDVAPLYGALVISSTAWNKIAPADQAIMAASAKVAEKKFFDSSTTADDSSLTTMKTRGLTVNTPDPKALAAFRAEADRLVTSIRGQLVPNDIYDMALRERDAYRKNKK